MSRLLPKAFRVLHGAVPALVLAALVLPGGASAQLREIVAKNVSASSSGTVLEIQFADQGSLEIAFADGAVYVDGDAVGSYEPGDALDEAWRGVLGRAMALENGALAEMLDDWTVPGEIAGDLADVAGALDEALEDALRDVEVQVDLSDEAISISIGDEGALLNLLIGSVGRLGVLDEALEGIEEGFRVHIDEDVVVERNEVVRGTLVVIEGALRVEGEVDGDVVVVGGELDLEDGGVIRGEARVADARIVRNRGEVRGGLVDLLEDERDAQAELRDRLRDEIREEIRRDLRNEIRNVTRLDLEHDDDGFSLIAPFRPVIRGVGGVMEKLIVVFILGLVGAGFLAFAGENMDTIAETARKSPGRSAMVGFAGSFLLIPVWILGAVALTVSIIGIPVAIAWLPLFPLAAMLAALLGYLAVAQNAGEWLADSSWPWTGWIRKSNPLVTLVGGLLGLVFAFIVGHLISIAPFLGVFSGLLFFIGGLLTFFAIMIGFGAVLLTRGGRRREYYGPMDADAAWEAAMSVDVDEPVNDADRGDDSTQAEGK